MNVSLAKCIVLSCAAVGRECWSLHTDAQQLITPEIMRASLHQLRIYDPGLADLVLALAVSKAEPTANQPPGS